MHEDIVITKDMSYDDILELSEQVLIPAHELLIIYRSLENVYHR